MEKEQPMKRRRLGRTGCMVSEISLGTVELGLAYGIAAAKPDEAVAAKVLNHALDSGIDFIDTARAYGDSESIIGRALKGRRKEVFLATKAQPAMGIAASAEESLRRLQTDCVDLLMVHCAPGDAIDAAPLLESLIKIQRAGMTRFIGASVYGEESALAAIASGIYDALQIAYSALDRRAEHSVLPAAAAADLGIVARSVLLKGALTPRHKLLPDSLAPIRDAVQEMMLVESEDGLPALSYRYVLGHPQVHTALVGTADSDEVDAAIRYAARGPLSPDQRMMLQAISIGDDRLLNPGNWPVF
jgi:aryl-alcohol dehydrogenase-like predicted oxidoreductase